MHMHMHMAYSYSVVLESRRSSPDVDVDVAVDDVVPGESPRRRTMLSIRTCTDRIEVPRDSSRASACSCQRGGVRRCTRGSHDGGTSDI